MPEVLWAEPCERGQRCELVDEALRPCGAPAAAFGMWEEAQSTVGMILCGRHLRGFGWTGPMPQTTEPAPKRSNPQQETRRSRPFVPRMPPKVNEIIERAVPRMEAKTSFLGNMRRETKRMREEAIVEDGDIRIVRRAT